MKKIFINNELEVDCSTEETILNAILRSSNFVDHSCLNGRCGKCVCYLDQGGTRIIQPEIFSIDSSKNEVLMCSRAPLSDLNIKVDIIKGFKPLPVVRLPSKINSINRVCENIIHLNLRFPPNIKFDFYPGQYVNLTTPIGVKRSYSIASSVNKNTIDFYIKRINGGQFSEYLFNKAVVDDLIRIEGPLGSFFLRNVIKKHLILVATGTGIAPFKSMIESNLLEQFMNVVDIHLIIGNRYQNEFTFIPDSTKITNYLTLSQKDLSWTHNNGYVQDVLKNINLEMNEAEVYACGSENMINDLFETFILLGGNKADFYSDVFLASGEL